MLFMRVFFIALTGLTGFVAAEEVNLVSNGNFEDGFKSEWYGGVFGDGPGKVITSDQKPYEGKFSAYLLKERGPKGSGCQLFSTRIPIKDSGKIIFSMKYRGAGNFILSYWNKINDQWVPVKNNQGKEVNQWVVLRKEDDWTSFSMTFPVSAEFLKDGEVAVRLQFQVWGQEKSSEELYLDDISITKVVSADQMK